MFTWFTYNKIYIIPWLILHSNYFNRKLPCVMMWRVDISELPKVSEPLLHFTDICLNTGLLWMVAVMVELILGITEFNVKVTDCPTLFSLVLVLPGSSILALNVRFMEVIDWCMKVILHVSLLLC